MRRREFISVLGGAAVAWPLAARAQQQAMPVVGFLHAGTAATLPNIIAGFRLGLKETGYVEGQNLAVEFRWGDNKFDRLPALAADLVRRQVAVIVSGGGPPSALAAKAATSIIPIVLAFGSDPVRLGLVASMNKPGGNVTGVTFITTELVGKRLGLLCELVPHAKTVAYLWTDPQNSTIQQQTRQQISDFLAAAHALGRQPIVVEVGSDLDFEGAFATLDQRRADALVVAVTPIFDSYREKFAALTARHKIPAIYQVREYARDGGLMTYGADYADAFRQCGVYVGRILKGTKPADLPFQQSTKFELVINLKAAKALGLTIPPMLLARADEVIE